MNDPLTEAILAAGRELGHEHGWTFDGGVEKAPKETSVFTQVLLKHLAPLSEQARKDYLGAELSATRAKLRTLAAMLTNLDKHS